MNVYLVKPPSVSILQEFYGATGLKPNILISMKEYFDNYKGLFKVVSEIKPYVNKFILDSGGFSTNDIKDKKTAEDMKNKYLIFIELYRNYIEKTFEYIFAFDYIYGNIDFNLNSDWYDEQHSVNKMVVPVIHNIHNNTEVDRYSSYHPKHISIGKCPDKTNVDFLKPVIDEIRKKSKFHFLGVTAPKILTKIIVDNCDSKSWIDESKSGVLNYFYEDDKEIKQDNVHFPKYIDVKKSGAILYEKYKNIEKIYEIGKIFGKVSEDFISGNQQDTLMLCSIYNYMKLEELLSRYYKERDAIEMTKTLSYSL